MNQTLAALPTVQERPTRTRRTVEPAGNADSWAICPKCGARGVRTMDTRNHVTLAHIRRRRKACPSCQWRWSTVEVPIAELNAIADYWSGLRAAAEALRDLYVPPPALLDRLGHPHEEAD